MTVESKTINKSKVYILEAIQYRAKKKIEEIEELEKFAMEILGLDGDSAGWISDLIWTKDSSIDKILKMLKIELTE